MTASAFANVRFGSEADMAASSIDVCFASESGHQLSSAMSALCQKQTFCAAVEALLFDYLVSGRE